MTAELGPNRYGKSAIRLVRVDRHDERHRVRDLTIAIALEGDFAASYVDGDNSLVVATDTMKNTAYALAADRDAEIRRALHDVVAIARDRFARSNASAELAR